MKLSEAIRLGAMLRPQAFFAAFDGVGTCALGAAADAIGINFEREGSFVPRQEWPWLDDEVKSPLGDGRLELAGYVIADLNDTHRWTREHIADWVESVEPQEVRAAIEEPQAELAAK